MADAEIRDATAFSSISVKEAAYVYIETQIRNLKHRHNELSNISRLPPEILATIFQYAGHGLLRRHISQICQRWRHVAINNPHLWSHITFVNPRWTQELLNRSKMAPLTVDADLTQYYYFRNSSISEGKEKIMCMVKTAFSHVSRVRKLRLKLRPADFPDVLALLASPAPLLEHCDIIFASADQEALPNLFNGICPRLTSLSTDRCILNWQAPIFSNLQNLKIDSAGLVPMCQFLTALSSMSYLKSLEMSVTSISNSDDHLVHVELPHLVKLWLRADFAGWMRLLEHIDAPNTTCLQLHNNSRDHIDQTQQVALAHRLVNQISKYMLEPIRSMTIDGMGLKMWVASSSENPRFDISVPYEAREQISKVILPALSYRELNSVTIGASLDAETWLNCFADLENLKEIEVHEGPGFLSALESGIPKRATKNCEALKFKAMNRLTIQGWNLTECAPNQENGSHMKRLKTFLRARGKYAEPLDELVVQRCRCLPNREVETLRKIVKVLDYDPTKNYRR